MSTRSDGPGRPGTVAGTRSGRTRAEIPAVDTEQPNAARVYDCLLGGRANFAADRRAAEMAASVYPGGMPAMRAMVRANRDFVGRAVRYLAGEAGIRQFLDIGTGIPNADNVHAVAQKAAPESRIVCADYDPVVLAHAHTLMTSTPEGATDFVCRDFRDVDGILADASATIDLDKPVAVMLVALLHFFHDQDDPHGMVRRYLEAVPSGSYLAISHVTADFVDWSEAADRGTNAMTEPVVLRARDEVARFFDGLDLVEPGIVAVDAWHQQPPEGSKVGYYAAVGRKP